MTGIQRRNAGSYYVLYCNEPSSLTRSRPTFLVNFMGVNEAWR